MSSVLHPVGPEPAQTYWIRRAAVLSVAVLVLAVVVALIVNGTSSGSAVQGEPSPPPAPPPTAAASSSASTSPTAKKSRPTRTSTASPKATATATATATAKPKPSPKAAAKTTKTTKTTTSRPPAPPNCPAAQLRPTLTGKQELKINADNKFRLSLINGSGRTCVAEVTAENFELKIYSGKDRIWSTDDCSKAIKTTKKTIKAEQALEWSLTWNGRRSRSDCKNRPEVPKSGTYFATAQLDGAKPVQLRMILVD